MALLFSPWPAGYRSIYRAAKHEWSCGYCFMECFRWLRLKSFANREDDTLRSNERRSTSPPIPCDPLRDMNTSFLARRNGGPGISDSRQLTLVPFGPEKGSLPQAIRRRKTIKSTRRSRSLDWGGTLVMLFENMGEYFLVTGDQSPLLKNRSETNSSGQLRSIPISEWQGDCNRGSFGTGQSSRIHDSIFVLK